MRRTDSILTISVFLPQNVTFNWMCCYFFLFNYFWKCISNFWVKIASTPFFFLTPNVMFLTYTYTQQLNGSSTAFSLWPISTSKHGLFVYGHTAASVIRVVDISQGWAWVQCWRVLFPLGRCQIRTAEGWILHYLQFAGRFFLICMPCSTGKHAKRA